MVNVTQLILKQTKEIEYKSKFPSAERAMQTAPLSYSIVSHCFLDTVVSLRAAVEQEGGVAQFSLLALCFEHTG